MRREIVYPEPHFPGFPPLLGPCAVRVLGDLFIEIYRSLASFQSQGLSSDVSPFLSMCLISWIRPAASLT